MNLQNMLCAVKHLKFIMKVKLNYGLTSIDYFRDT